MSLPIEVVVVEHINNIEENRGEEFMQEGAIISDNNHKLKWTVDTFKSLIDVYELAYEEPHHLFTIFDYSELINLERNISCVEFKSILN